VIETMSEAEQALHFGYVMEHHHNRGRQGVEVLADIARLGRQILSYQPTKQSDAYHLSEGPGDLRPMGMESPGASPPRGQSDIPEEPLNR
jgi:hypothetical protein